MTYSEDYKDSFLIQINEAQRKAIWEALILTDLEGPVRTQEETEELRMLIDMFADLPNQDNTHLNADGKRDLMIHGFCL